jgi:hypothetical protein
MTVPSIARCWICACPTFPASSCWPKSKASRPCAICPSSSFTGKELTVEEETQLHKIAKSIIIKGVQSPERLLDETALFLHRVVTESAAGQTEDARTPAPDRRGAGQQKGAGGR